MQRSQSRRSDISEAEPDGMAEQELEKCVRHLRLMETDREDYTLKTRNNISKQHAEMSVLEREHEELMKNHRLAGSKQNQSADDKNMKKLGELLDEEDEISTAINDTLNNIKEMKEQIRIKERTKDQQRKNMGGVNNSQLKQVKTQKLKKVLENRLDHEYTQFNSLLNENKCYREMIEHLRTEKALFDKKENVCQKKMKHLKQDRGRFLEESIAATEARDDAQMRMVALKEKCEKDAAQFEVEYKELKRIIDHDKKLRDFMETKAEERSEMEEESTRRRKMESDKEKGEKAEETVESYEEAFEKIKRVTGIDDIDLLVKRFIEVEDKNFALFNYVNELNNDTETLQDEIDGIENEVRKFKDEGVKLEDERKAILRNLEEKLAQTQDKIQAREQQSKHTTKILDQLKEGTDSLFNKINCDRTMIDDMLGATSGVTESNMMQYLGIIEQRTNELLQIQAIQAAKEAERGEVPVGLLGHGPQNTSVSISIVPPSTGDDYDSDQSEEGSDEEQSRPLTQQELRNKVLKGISKKEGAPKKTHHHPGSASSNTDKSPKKKTKK